MASFPHTNEGGGTNADAPRAQGDDWEDRGHRGSHEDESSKRWAEPAEAAKALTDYDYNAWSDQRALDVARGDHGPVESATA